MLDPGLDMYILYLYIHKYIYIMYIVYMVYIYI